MKRDIYTHKYHEMPYWSYGQHYNDTEVAAVPMPRT